VHEIGHALGLKHPHDGGPTGRPFPVAPEGAPTSIARQQRKSPCRKARLPRAFARSRFPADLTSNLCSSQKHSLFLSQGFSSIAPGFIGLERAPAFPKLKYWQFSLFSSLFAGKGSGAGFVSHCAASQRLSS
jgi:hypothetical protein